MRRPTWSQIMAGILVLERIHSTLEDLIPSYSDYIRNNMRKLKRRLGISQTLHDKITNFFGSSEIMEDTVRTDHSVLDSPLWIFLKDNIEVHHVYGTKRGDDSISIFQTSDLEFIDMSELTDATPDTILTRKFQELPNCIKQPEDTVGLCPYLITFGYHKNKPFVMQIRNAGDPDDDRDYTMIDFLFSPGDKDLFDEFRKKLKAYTRNNSPLKKWIVSCEGDDMGAGTVAFHFEEELCKKLRADPYKFDINLYNIDVKNLIDKDIKNFIKKQDSFCKDGFDGRRAYLLEGPPGTGKSDIIRSIISILPDNYTTIVLNEKNIGELRYLKRMKFLFPALVVIEDIDLLVTSKNRWQILLNFLDGLHAPNKIITIMTSNNAGSLLASITNRPGRIDRIIHVGPGDEVQRTAQLESLTKNLKMPDGMTATALALRTKGCTVAQLRELIRRSVIYTEAMDNSIEKDAIATVLQEFDRQKAEATEMTRDLALESLTSAADDGDMESLKRRRR